MAEYKKQHILAENYLKGFSDEDYYKNTQSSCPIWFYDILNKELKYKSPKNVAWLPYYYSKINESGEYEHFIEKEFSKLESLISILVRKIDSNVWKLRKNKKIDPLTNEDRILLIHFIFWHMKKVPSTIDAIYERIKEIYTDLSKIHNITFTEAEVKNETLDLMLKIGNGEKFDFINVLSEKDFRIVWLSNDKSSFITTDTPVTRFNKMDNNGIAIESTEIYFPLNQRAMILLHGNGNLHVYQKVIDRKQLYELNKFVASNAKYFIVARDKEYLTKILSDLNYEFS